MGMYVYTRYVIIAIKEKETMNPRGNTGLGYIGKTGMRKG